MSKELGVRSALLYLRLARDRLDEAVDRLVDAVLNERLDDEALRIVKALINTAMTDMKKANVLLEDASRRRTKTHTES